MMTKHPLYQTWKGMMDRCYRPNSISYPHYGGQGVDVCERWHKFENFATDIGPKPTKDHTLERMDVAIGYLPTNCCWETRTNQCVNRRRFKTNTSGQTGVLKIGNLWRAHFQYERIRYHIGTFSNFEQAVTARVTFVEAFFLDREVAIASLPRAPICETRRVMF